MWKPERRCAADRRGLRYPSDLSDTEWALVEPMIPPAKRGGRPSRNAIRIQRQFQFDLVADWNAVLAHLGNARLQPSA
jgi:transposase